MESKRCGLSKMHKNTQNGLRMTKIHKIWWRMQIWNLWTKPNTNTQEWMGETQQLKTKDLVDKNLIKLTKWQIKGCKGLGKGIFFCGAIFWTLGWTRTRTKLGIQDPTVSTKALMPRWYGVARSSRRICLRNESTPPEGYEGNPRSQPTTLSGKG